MDDYILNISVFSHVIDFRHNITVQQSPNLRGNSKGSYNPSSPDSPPSSPNLPRLRAYACKYWRVICL